MSKTSYLLLGIFLIVTNLCSAKETLQPFTLASVQTIDYQQVVNETKQKLIDAGFQIIGEYVPFGQNTIIIATNDDALKVAAMSKRGAYGAPVRVSVSQYGDEVEVSYANPLYYEKAY